MKVKISQAVALITAYIKAKLVPMVVGSPGIGKSDIVHQIAKEYGLKVIDLRLAQCDPTDLMGFPSIKDKKAGYVPMETFPIESDPIPAGYNGWLLFLDEFNSASVAVQAAAYKIVLDRMVGQHKIHPNVAIVCAGNLESDNAIVQPLSTALQSRLAHLELQLDAKEWTEWAFNRGIDHRITDYIQFKPDALYTFQPDHTDKTYACPRTWEFLNRLMPLSESENFLAMASGVVSEGIAREFLGFLRIYRTLPKVSDIVKSPKTIDVPAEPSILFAISGSIASNTTNENFKPLLEYVERLPKEFQVVTVRETVRRNKEILNHPALAPWLEKSALEIF
jgi:hypothetical protein